MTKVRILAILLELVSMLNLLQQAFQFGNPINIEQSSGFFANNITNCLQTRGRIGKWVYDCTMQQMNTLSPRCLFQEEEEKRSFLTSRLRWQDESGCHVSIMDETSWCKLVSNLNVSRVYIAGDSTMMDFSQSLRSVLSPSTLLDEKDVPPWKLHCGQLLSTTEFNLFPTVFPPEPSFLTSHNSGRNLILINFGATNHSLQYFQGNMTDLMEWVEEWRRPNDIVIFRSLIPPPKRCSSHVRDTEVDTTNAFRKDKFANNSEFRNDGEAHDFLDRLEAFNEYAVQLSAEYRVHFLNVYNSTASWQDNTNGCNQTFHPACSDWWVHFLYSMLLDIWRLEQQRQL